MASDRTVSPITVTDQLGVGALLKVTPEYLRYDACVAAVIPKRPRSQRRQRCL